MQRLATEKNHALLIDDNYLFFCSSTTRDGVMGIKSRCDIREWLEGAEAGNGEKPCTLD